jgi:hypothetical protein
MDPGPTDSSELWKKLDTYHQAVESGDTETANTITLESILEEDDLLSFLQHKHQPLLQFLKKPEHLKSILLYITSGPESNQEYSQKCSKILCHNTNDIREAVFANAKENLDILFGFEDENNTESTVFKKLDALHQGLLNQVVVKFLNTHNCLMTEYLSKKQPLQDNPKQLLYAAPLLVTLVDINYCYPDSDIAKWFEQIGLLDLLVSAFDGKDSDEVLNSAVEVLGMIVQSQSPLTSVLETDSTIISNLLKNMFDPENPRREHAISEGLSVLNMIALRYQTTCFSGGPVPIPLQPVLENISQLKELLEPGQLNVPEFVNTSGNLVPFGMTRMRLVELFRSLLVIKNDQIYTTLLEINLFSSLTEAFFRHKWNNILQTSVMSMWVTVFDSKFRLQALQQTGIVSRISELLLEDFNIQARGEPVSAVHGFLVQFRGMFMNLQKDPEIAKAVFESNEKWQEYLQADPEASAELSRRPPGVFDGMNFVLDVSDSGHKEQLATLIRENSGTVSENVDRSTSFVVSPPSDFVYRSMTIQQAINLSLSVVTDDFVYQSVEKGTLQPFGSFSPDWDAPQQTPPVVASSVQTDLRSAFQPESDLESQQSEEPAEEQTPETIECADESTEESAEVNAMDESTTTEENAPATE